MFSDHFQRKFNVVQVILFCKSTTDWKRSNACITVQSFLHWLWKMHIYPKIISLWWKNKIVTLGDRTKHFVWNLLSNLYENSRIWLFDLLQAVGKQLQRFADHRISKSVTCNFNHRRIQAVFLSFFICLTLAVFSYRNKVKCVVNK